MGVIEALLAIVGLLFLLVLLISVLSKETPVPPSGEDAATPYREGLHAAVRMQQVAQDLEQQIYAEAARQMEREPAGSRSERP
jgi:hypothetical protein